MVTVQVRPERAETQQRLFQLLANRQCQLSQLNERYWTVIGSGSVGAKAEDMMKKTWAMERAGFDIGHRTVLAMGFFGDYEKTGMFSNGELKQIAVLAARYKETLLAVRSSAHGDCRGTGIYESTFVSLGKDVEVNAEILKNAIVTVVRSEQTEKAREFRRVNKLPDGIAVIIEPAFGEKNEGVFAPHYGGFGYTSTSSGNGYVSFRPGLPTLAVNGEGILVFEDENTNMCSIASMHINSVRSGEARITWYQAKETVDRSGDGEAIVLDNGEIVLTSRCDGNKYMDRRNLDWIFDKMKKLEALLGKPQYIEWATLFYRGEVKVRIVQIADVDIKTDTYEFCDNAKTVAKGTYVLGTGDKRAKELVWVDGRSESLDEMHAYNKTHNGHVVGFWGNILMGYRYETLGFEHVSNAVAVLERVTGDPHTKDLSGHFGGSLETSGIVAISTAQFNDELLERYRHIEYVPIPKWRNWGWIKKMFGEPEQVPLYPHLKIYRVPMRVLTSERQQKGVIELLEE